MDLLFDSNLVNPPLKTNVGHICPNLSPNFVIFVIWTALIVGE